MHRNESSKDNKQVRNKLKFQLSWSQRSAPGLVVVMWTDLQVWPAVWSGLTGRLKAEPVFNMLCHTQVVQGCREEEGLWMITSSGLCREHTGDKGGFFSFHYFSAEFTWSPCLHSQTTANQVELRQVTFSASAEREGRTSEVRQPIS